MSKKKESRELLEYDGERSEETEYVLKPTISITTRKYTLVSKKRTTTVLKQNRKSSNPHLQTYKTKSSVKPSRPGDKRLYEKDAETKERRTVRVTHIRPYNLRPDIQRLQDKQKEVTKKTEKNYYPLDTTRLKLKCLSKDMEEPR